MEFQLLSAVLEDRYPTGYTCPASEVLTCPDEVFDHRKTIESRSGCIAFLFGRNAKGKSICLRQEGVFPCLYFECRADDTLAAMKRELYELVKEKLGGNGLVVEEKTFCHAYGFEPDASTASGRQTHRYLEVRYPNLASFRMMKKLQRAHESETIRRMVREKEQRLKHVTEVLTNTARRAMQGHLSDEERLMGQSYEEEQKVLTTHTLPALRAKVKDLNDDETNESEEAEGGECETPEASYRYPHEHFVEPLTRYFQEESLSPGRWYSFPLDRPSQVRVTYSCVEYDIMHGELTELSKDEMSPYVVCYYDIETTSLDPETHPVIQVSLVFECEQVLDKHVVVLNDVDESVLEDIRCHICNSEREVLSTFSLLIREKDPDFLVAYNGVNFDNRFLNVRASLREKTDSRPASSEVSDFFFFSRFALKPCRLRDLRLSSSGMGDNLLRYFDLPGRSTFDWFVKLKRDLTSEASYSLNHFARSICGDEKKEMDHREIPVLQEGSKRDRARLAEYCVHDSVLLARLNQARTMIIEILQFASVFGIVPEWVYFRGQQVRFISHMLRKVRRLEAIPILLNVPTEGFVGAFSVGKFEGATVNDPIRGFFKKPVIVVDWASLYPSIMRGHNLCHSTHIARNRIAALVADGWEVVPPSTRGTTDRVIVEHDIGDSKKTYFVSEHVKRGILPIILEELASKRKAAKALHKKYAKLSKEERANESHRILASVYDGQQLAMKVAMNSIYGACGAADTGKYPNLDISSTVTAEGREAMVIKKRILPVRFPTITIVYGDTDSIMMTFEDVKTIAESGVRGKEVADFVTQYFRDELGLPTMVMEFEKSFLPYLQEGKKRYAGNKFEPGVDDEMVHKGVDCKGIETERKDTLPFTKSLMTSILDDLMQRMDEAQALKTFESHMDRLVRNEVPFEDFIMKKNLSAKVSGKTDSIVQAKVNKDRRDRDPGSEAATGEQVEYIIVNGFKKEKTTNLAQDPTFARENGLKPNRLWYFEHAIEEPVRKIFDAFPDVDFKRVCNRYREVLNSKRLNIGDGLSAMMKPFNADVEEASTLSGYVPRDPPKKVRKKK